MKHLFITLLLLALAMQISAWSAFNEEYFVPNILTVCFNAQAINTTTGDIPITHNEQGQVQIGLGDFDRAAIAYDFIGLHRKYWVKDQEWKNNDGSYPMNIFSVYLRDNSVIEQALKALIADPDIIWAEYEAINRLHYTTNDPLLSAMWHIEKMQVPEMWEFIKGDTTMIVAIVDSGVKWNHPDLRANIYVNWAEAIDVTIDWDNGIIIGGDGIDNDDNGKIDDVIGWDFCHNDSDIPRRMYVESNQSYQSYGGNEHGTHVAGCAGAVGDNGIGVTGVAINIKLLGTKHQKTIYVEPQYADNIQNGYAGIYYAADAGAHIINCSWGGPGGAGEATTAVNYALNKNSLVVSSAGNGDRNGVEINLDQTPHYPSDADGAVCVAASRPDDTKAPFSNYGDAVAVTAPGTGIFSTWYEGSLENATDNYYSTQGTSMSSPIVAGIAALMRSMHPEYTPAQVRERLIVTCDPMIQNEEGPYMGKLGGGRVNAFKAVLSDLMPNISIAEITVSEHEGDGDGVPNIGETIAVSIRLENEIYWKNAIGTSATLSSHLEGVEIISGAINYGNITNGMTVNPPANFLVYLSPSVNTFDIPLTLTITANQGATEPYPYNRNRHFTVSISMSKPNWPLELSNPTMPPIVENLDGTGMRMIVFTGNTLHIVDEDKTPNPGFPLTLPESGIAGKIAVGQMLPGSLNKQLVVYSAPSSGIIRLIDHTGEILATYQVGSTIRNCPIIADLNGDGQNDIVVVYGSQGSLLILNGNDLSPWEGYPINLGSMVNTNLAIGDVNGDGTLNIVANAASRVYVFDPLTKSNITGFPVQIAGTASAAGPTLANLDNDNDLEIVFASNTTSNVPISILKSDGTIYGQTTNPTAIETEIALVDLTNNGKPELIYGDNAGNIHIRDASLEYLPNFPLNVGAGVRSSPVFACINGDGAKEIIFSDNAGMLHALKADGQYSPGFPIKVTNSAVTQAPWVGDFDGNDTADILLSTPSGIIFFDHKFDISNTAWNTFRGNLQNTASWTDFPVSDSDIVGVPLVNTLIQNYPNPFNPSTTIEFGIRNAEYGMRHPVTIDIFNIKGQKVRSLVNDTFDSGTYKVVWNGTDDNGRSVASGIYFYKMQTNDFVQTKKMIMMK